MSTLLALDGVSKQYGSLMAVDGVTLGIESGARHALIGPNGAGKSTLFGLIAGTSATTAGTIALAGEDITRRSDSWRARVGVAKTFQHSSLFLSLSVADNIALAAQRLTGHGLRIRTRAAHCPGVAEEVERCLALVGLADRPQVRVSALSHGERRQLEVAVALATRPRLLLLDEPTAGMSAAESGRFVELVESLPPDVTVLLIEHDLDVVFRLADRISVLHLGKLLADGTPEQVRADEVVQQAYLGSGAARELFLTSPGSP
jgi:branched-chain amino acid transport system ATP-binding protein